MVRQFDPGGLYQVRKLVVNVLISVEVKSLQHLDVLYLVEPYDGHTLDQCLPWVLISEGN